MNNEEDFMPVSEVLKNNDTEVLQVEENTPKKNISNTEDHVIELDRLFVSDDDEKNIIENEIKNKDRDRLIEKIQIGLVVFLIISALLVYFFGYNLVEPFIKLE